MNQWTCCAVGAIIVAGAVAFAQGGAGQALPTFKGNELGMSLSDFKRGNVGQPVWINTGDPHKRRNKKLTREVGIPLCTDEFDGFDGSDPSSRVPGEVICNAALGPANIGARTVADDVVDRITYHFYKEKLYKIEIDFKAFQFPNISAAFIGKYGKPTSVSTEPYQNGFGARWNGQILAWISGPVDIVIVEGSGNGPAQDAFESPSSAALTESDLSPSPVRSSPATSDF